MADEEFAELAEINLSEQYGEPSWVGCGRSPSNNTGSLSHHRSASMFTPQAIVRAAEAEDIIGPYRSHIDGHRSGRGRSGMYYSPPGTSYTIVERSTPAPHNKHPRGSFLTGGNGSTSAHLTSSPAFTTAHTKSKAAAKSLSPEQVIKLLGGGTNLRKPAPAPERPASRLPPPPSIDQLTTKTVNMSRSVESGQGFGICVKGGIEDSGVGVYISRIEEGSVAERAGLRPGDSILEVNGTPFTSISHEEALKMLKSSKYLSMTVRSPKKPPMNSFDSANQGNVWVLRQTYTWMNRQGRPTSPPPEYRTPLNHQNIHPRSLMDKIRKVDLNIEPGQSLGLMIRGGIEYNLGIFVTGVDKDSVADRAGILVGDQILEVNGQSFLEVTHDEAVGTLKHYKRMTLTVRDCDKVPHSCSSYDPRQTSVRHCEKSAASQMVEEKARIVLKKSEFSTLCYYLEEYNAQRISVESFVSVLTELLNTPDKYTLLTELREVLAPHDRTMFDELVYGQGLKDRNQTNRFIGSFGELDGAEFSANRFRRKSSLDEGLSRLEQNSDQDVNMSGYMDDLRSRLGGWTEKVKSWYLGNPLMARTHGHNLGSSEEGEQLLGGDSKTWHNTTDPNNSLMENESNIVPDDQGNLRIRVKKMKPLLGIAIEGGANTKHPLPRIINIHENGAAFDASGLEVGQLILEVDGHKVEGMQHQEVARLIAESFARREKNYIEFLVIEAKKSNLEPKPTALIFLES